jgi:hypothetical protein
MIITIIEKAFPLLALFFTGAICYSFGKDDGRKSCKKEFEETFDFEWVEVPDEPDTDER